MLPECFRHARLAEACRCGQENELAVAFLRVVPAALQQADLLGPADQGVKPFAVLLSKRPQVPLSPVTRHSLTASGIPLNSCGPRSS